MFVILYNTYVFYWNVNVQTDTGQGEGSVKETNLVNETVRFAMEYTDASPIGKRVSWQFFSLEVFMIWVAA